jgi:hypothetical protein
MELQIVYLSPNELTPYEGNARKHGPLDIEQIKESIRVDGFNDPIGIWGDSNLIVEGHGRQIAAIEMGLDKVPCIRLDHLTDTQRRDYALRHNRTAELSAWDDMKRQMEVAALELEGLDLSGLEWETQEQEEQTDADGWTGDERERTLNALNLNDYDPYRTDGFYNMPTLRPCHTIPETLIGFNYVNSTEETGAGVHFFLDDYQFERIWNSPHEIIERLKRFPCTFTPDFSLYADMPVALQVYNVYRARLIGQMMQDAGLETIPTVSWAKKESFDFCFDGLPHGGVVAVSTVGVVTDKNALKLWKAGMRELIKRIEPETVLVYGSVVDFDFGKTPVKYYEARKFEKE